MKTGRFADALMAEVEAASAEERRSVCELVGKALERYLAQRCWFRGDEVHDKIAQGLASLRQGKGLDGELVMAELTAELVAAFAIVRVLHGRRDVAAILGRER